MVLMLKVLFVFKNNNMKKTIYLFITIGIISCASLKIHSEDYNVLNAYLQSNANTSINLVEENYFNGSILGYYGMYKKWYDAEQKTKDLEISINGNIEWIFTKEDIEFMKKQYHKWETSVWDKNKVKGKINLIKSKPNSYGMSQTTRISYPFYDKTMTKAMLIVSKNKASLNGSINIILMKKINGKWKNVGTLLYSIS